MVELFVLFVVFIASVLIGVYVYEQALESTKKLVVLAVVSPLSMLGLMLPVLNIFREESLGVLIQEQAVLFVVGFVLSLIVISVVARITRIVKK
ncbi:MAG: hypothetical protein ACMXYD_05270 [Candidatus Woesearchaeota archaeon]